MKRKLTPREIAAIRRRRFMMLADNGGERPEPEPSWNMRVVAHPKSGYEMPQTTGNFTLVKQDGDTYYYQHDGSDSTGGGVLNGYDSVMKNINATDVIFNDCGHITTIGAGFLMYNETIKQLDLSMFTNIDTIDVNFLGYAIGIESLIFPTTQNAITIGDGFLNGSHMQQINLTPLSNIVSVGGAFLEYCRKLNNIDLSPLSNITSVPGQFLEGCSALVSLDLTPLSNIVSIDHRFLMGCSSMTSIKVPWATIPTTDTASFMYDVPSTCSIEVPCEALSVYKSTSPWSNRADYINGGEGCEEPEPQWNMKVVAHPEEGYSMPITTGNFSLTEQDGDTYYYQHDGSSSTGENVLYDADNGAYWGVESVAFKNCEHITSIDNRFFNECSTLVSIDLSALSNITTIDGNFLRKCSSLPSVDLSALSNVTTIQQSFLNGCSSMTTIDLSPLINCTYSNSYFLYNCTNLATLIAPWVTDIPRISNVGFMSSVPTSCSIIVPCGLVDTYKATSPWSMKKSQLVGDC